MALMGNSVGGHGCAERHWKDVGLSPRFRTIPIKLGPCVEVPSIALQVVPGYSLAYGPPQGTHYLAGWLFWAQLHLLRAFSLREGPWCSHLLALGLSDGWEGTWDMVIDFEGPKGSNQVGRRPIPT